jgi:hypothetical protein
MHRTWHTTIALVVSLALISCLRGPNFRRKPDAVLFRRATSALARSQFDVASLDLQTLVNTWADSEYAPKAKRLLTNDPHLECHRLAQSSFTPPASCNEGN